MNDFAVVFAKCRRGCRARLVVRGVVNGEVPVLYARPLREGEDASALVPSAPGMVYEDAPRMTPVCDAVPYLAWCVAHRSPLQGRPIRTFRSEQDCSDECEVATGSSCRCRCGGLNHGVRS